MLHTHKPACPPPTPSGTLVLHSAEDFQDFRMTQNISAAEQALRDAAREYHRNPTRGKISVTPTKAFDYTSRGNLVAVITNGTAVLGLGDIGPLASKPVMEGKGCLFKK